MCHTRLMKTQLFQYQYQVKLADTDAAGVLYFARLYDIVHGAYESYLQAFSLSLKTMLDERNYHLPIVHSEADYKQFILLGDIILIEIYLEKQTQHTFSLNYTLLNQQSQLLASAQTIHISIDKKSLKKIKLPEEIRQLFI